MEISKIIVPRWPPTTCEIFNLWVQLCLKSSTKETNVIFCFCLYLIFVLALVVNKIDNSFKFKKQKIIHIFKINCCHFIMLKKEVKRTNKEETE